MGKTVRKGKNMLLLLLAGAGALYILQGFLYRKYWSRGLGIDIRFDARSAYEGDTAYLAEEITNDKLLFLPALEVNLAVNRALKFSKEAKENANVSDQSYRRDIFSLFAHQKVVRKLPFVCGRRGFYEIKKADVIGYDFFFRKSFHDNRNFQTSLYVYPKLVDSRRLSILCRAVSGMTVTRSRLFYDPFCFSGIRDYSPSDPMNQINWKASAKGQGLLVNQFDSTTNIQVKLILDTEDTGMIRRDKQNEEGIRIAASLALRLAGRGMDVTVAGNGIKRIHIKNGAGQMQKLYEELARIDIYEKTERLCSLLEEEKKNLLHEVVYVIISMNQDRETVGAIASLAEKASPILWVMPVSASQEEILPEGSFARDSSAASGRGRRMLQGVDIYKWELEG